ncbi:hypothetical protein [Humibacter ginsenosidimutans]|nr:hypothetical protein [Humibacter ginsenosidimutans]
MTEAQTWTMIGVFSAGFLGMLTIVSTLFVHVVRSEVRRLDEKFLGVGGRFDTIDRRLDAMDRDVQALIRHTFGIDRDE